MCTAMRGATPVYLCTWAASSAFSHGSRGTPGWLNTLNRVPLFPNAHDGSSIWWLLSALFTSVKSCICPSSLYVSLDGLAGLPDDELWLEDHLTVMVCGVSDLFQQEAGGGASK